MSTVFPSKYQAEIVTVRWNFADVLPFGVVPISAVVTVTVSTGYDPMPAAFLLGAATISGTVVAQQITQGYVGVVYILTCTAVDANGRSYVKSSVQAVLNNVDSFYQPAALLELLGDLPDGWVGVPYSYPLYIEGGTPPYTDNRIIAGSMPAWLTDLIVGDLLVFSGNPNVVGVSTFTPEITDFAGMHANNPQEIEIRDPIITIMGDLPDGYVGGSWAGVTYTAVGGTPPYTWESLTGTVWPGVLGPMSSGGVVLPEIPTVAGAGVNFVKVTDSLGFPAAKLDPFTITETPSAMIVDTRAGFAFVSLDGIVFTTIANNMDVLNKGLNQVANGRFLSSNDNLTQYTDDLGATPWITSTGGTRRNRQLTRNGNTVVYGSNGPFETPMISADNGTTFVDGSSATGNGMYAPVYIAPTATIIAVGKGTDFMRSTDNADSFVSTGQAHGFNPNNLHNICCQYSGGAVFGGANILADNIRVVFTADGLTFSGGDIIAPAHVSNGTDKSSSDICVGFIDGIETVVLKGNAGGELFWTQDAGVTWDLTTYPLGPSITLDFIVWNGYVFVLGGTLSSVGYISYSFDLITWYPSTYPAGSQGFYAASA